MCGDLAHSLHSSCLNQAEEGRALYVHPNPLVWMLCVWSHQPSPQQHEALQQKSAPQANLTQYDDNPVYLQCIQATRCQLQKLACAARSGSTQRACTFGCQPLRESTFLAQRSASSALQHSPRANRAAQRSGMPARRWWPRCRGSACSSATQKRRLHRMRQRPQRKLRKQRPKGARIIDSCSTGSLTWTRY